MGSRNALSALLQLDASRPSDQAPSCSSTAGAVQEARKVSPSGSSLESSTAAPLLATCAVPSGESQNFLSLVLHGRVPPGLSTCQQAVRSREQVHFPILDESGRTAMGQKSCLVSADTAAFLFTLQAILDRLEKGSCGGGIGSEAVWITSPL